MDYYEKLCRKYRISLIYSTSYEMKFALATRMLQKLEKADPVFARTLLDHLADRSEADLEACIQRIQKGRPSKAPRRQRRPERAGSLVAAIEQTKNSKPWLNSDEKAAAHLHKTDPHWAEAYPAGHESMANAFFQTQRIVRELQEEHQTSKYERLCKLLADHKDDPIAFGLWCAFRYYRTMEVNARESGDISTITYASDKVDQVLDYDHSFSEGLALLFVRTEDVYTKLISKIDQLDEAKCRAMADEAGRPEMSERQVKNTVLDYFRSQGHFKCRQ